MVKPVRILIADDHELVRGGMRPILESEPGWVVCAEATTGREVLAKALDLRPDVIVLDIGLPEMNGIEVIRQLRLVMTTAVLVVTMHDSDEIVQEAIAAGANGYVLKTEASHALAEGVRVILQGREFISERVRAASGRQGHATDRAPGSARGLTSRERQVLQLLAEGHANKEIGSLLGISTKTAETHRARIMAKLEVHSMNELVRYAIRNRIIEP